MARSGTRLKVSWYQTADGARTPLDDGLYDSMLAITCKPTTWTDGVIRCTPQTTAASAYFLYTDASCTTPVLMNPNPLSPDLYLGSYTQPAALCGRQLVDHVYHPGAEITVATPYAKSGDSCFPYTTPGQHYYPLVDQPAAMFPTVATNYDATGAVAQMHWDSPDGMTWYRPEGQDATLGARCAYQIEYDTFDATHGVCDPRGQTANEFADSSCAMPMIDVPTGCSAPAYVAPPNVCAFTFDHQIRTVGGTISPAAVYQGASCTAGNTSGHADYYATASSAATVQTMSRSRDLTVTTRLKPIFFDTTGGVHFQTNEFYDSVLDTECAFGSNAICGPILSPTTKVLYTDAACTMPFDAAQINDDPPTYCPSSSPAPVPDYATKVISAGVVEYHRITTQHVGVVYASTGTCRRYPEIGIPQTWRIFEIDPTATSATAFESSTLVVDP